MPAAFVPRAPMPESPQTEKCTIRAGGRVTAPLSAFVSERRVDSSDPTLVGCAPCARYQALLTKRLLKTNLLSATREDGAYGLLASIRHNSSEVGRPRCTLAGWRGGRNHYF